jgi:hypothetical protein
MDMKLKNEYNLYTFGLSCNKEIIARLNINDMGSRPTNYFISVSSINYNTAFIKIYNSCKNVPHYIAGAQQTNLTWLINL